MGIVGLGMDVCAVDRIRQILNGPRGQRFRDRVFTAEEQAVCGGRADSASAYAARFAAKEALVKALGAPAGMRWTDMTVTRQSGPPSFRLSGVTQTVVRERRLRLHLAITHDAGIAAATVVAEREEASS